MSYGTLWHQAMSADTRLISISYIGQIPCHGIYKSTITQTSVQSGRPSKIPLGRPSGAAKC